VDENNSGFLLDRSLIDNKKTPVTGRGFFYYRLNRSGKPLGQTGRAMPVELIFRMALDAAGGSSGRQFAIEAGKGTGHLLDFELHGFVAADALTMVGVFVVSEGLILIDDFGVRFSGQGVEIVATGGHASGNRLCPFPGMVAGIAGQNEMAAMLELHGDSLGFHRIRRFQGNGPHGHAHLFITGNGGLQDGTGNKTGKQHHPHNR
jgi:hypothetical protein